MPARPAKPEDGAQIARIYNQGIEDGTATFETQPRTDREIRAWFDGVHPVQVVESLIVAALGFREVGIYEKHGQLNGAWRDVVIVEKLL